MHEAVPARVAWVDRCSTGPRPCLRVENTSEAPAEIAFGRAQRDHHGELPAKVTAHVSEDMVPVVLEETLTVAERTLVDRGESESISEIRRHFQHAIADELTSIVEQATGGGVRAFLSETDVDADVPVEVFLLAETMRGPGEVQGPWVLERPLA